MIRSRLVCPHISLCSLFFNLCEEPLYLNNCKGNVCLVNIQRNLACIYYDYKGDAIRDYWHSQKGKSVYF
jgi:hypothetical protein